ncbi:MFS transporter [Pseudolysinimonas kribbensis]|uniref:MFS transporter n=1 Tax=Pseudolysinimonas kribbensis TaxID=433641 RepID=A0ABQ6K1Y0_9MICO|nr:MFS transporter [Pseudolysinimonas kribbensis]GMA94617.1 MFS transporter [Pseudolysinimonas kribbensis]
MTSASSARFLPAGVATAGSAVAFSSLYLGAGALTPLLVAYQTRWDFPPAMLNVAFAVYAVGFLVAALTLGSLSDHVGRRPVLAGALVVQLASDVLFLVGTDIGWVIAGRVVQGVASGAATSAFTAALVELAPRGRKNLGAVLGNVSLTGGLALGSLLAGLALQFSPDANEIVFVVLIVLTVVGGVAVIASPETAGGQGGTARSLVPRVTVPAPARAQFAALAPVIAAVWMLAGLSGGLAPAMVRSVFALDSGFVNGFTGFVAPAVATLVALLLTRMSAGRATGIGIAASLIGSLGIVAGISADSLAIVLAGQAIAGLAFGASFSGAIRLILPLAPAHQRAAVVAAVYVVSYLAFGVPIVVEGVLATPFGTVPAVVGYTIVTILLTLVSLLAQLRLRRTV